MSWLWAIWALVRCEVCVCLAALRVRYWHLLGHWFRLCWNCLSAADENNQSAGVWLLLGPGVPGPNLSYFPIKSWHLNYFGGVVNERENGRGRKATTCVNYSSINVKHLVFSRVLPPLVLVHFFGRKKIKRRPSEKPPDIRYLLVIVFNDLLTIFKARKMIIGWRKWLRAVRLVLLSLAGH